MRIGKWKMQNGIKLILHSPFLIFHYLRSGRHDYSEAGTSTLASLARRWTSFVALPTRLRR